MRRGLTVLLLMLLAACGGGGPQEVDQQPSEPSGAPTSGTRIRLGGAEAVTWGEGAYGVVLAHGAAFDAASWGPQATAIAAQGATVIAVEDISPGGIRAAVEQLQGGGIDDVALVGGSAGADAILRLAADQPDLPHQLILLSANSLVEGLGTQPKLFLASEGESVAEIATQLADSAPGDHNQAKLLSGSAHAQNIFDTDQAEVLLEVILERLRTFGAGGSR